MLQKFSLSFFLPISMHKCVLNKARLKIELSISRKSIVGLAQ